MTPVTSLTHLLCKKPSMFINNGFRVRSVFLLRKFVVLLHNSLLTIRMRSMEHGAIKYVDDINGRR